VDVLGEYTQGLAKRIVRSAMTPALWLCCFGVACWIAAHLFSFRPVLEPLCIPLALAGMAPLALACWAYVHFALKKPDRLQSEEYQLRQLALTIMRKSAPVQVVDPASIARVVNPIEERTGSTGEDS
jgi:membrane protein implicated in regulation of membrane protease activity